MERYDAMNTVYEEKNFVRDNAEHGIEREISAAAAIGTTSSSWEEADG